MSFFKKILSFFKSKQAQDEPSSYKTSKQEKSSNLSTPTPHRKKAKHNTKEKNTSNLKHNTKEKNTSNSKHNTKEKNTSNSKNNAKLKNTKSSKEDKVEYKISFNPCDNMQAIEVTPTIKPLIENKVTFHELNLHQSILKALEDLQFESCTDIQKDILPYSLEKQDIIAKAQTGSGKSAAFLISCLQIMLEDKPTQYTASPRTLIIAPTRELVVQIAKDAQNICKYTNAVVASFFGGVLVDEHLKILQNRVDIVVATPGRLLDYVRRKYISLSKVEFFIIDEADRMLDMGFIPDVRRIIVNLPNKKRRITQLYSATLKPSILDLAQDFMKEDRVLIESNKEQLITDNIEQLIYPSSSKESLHLIMWYYYNDNLDSGIIFCNRKDTVNKVAKKLQKYNIECGILSGDIVQKKRFKILNQFKERQIKLLIATDVASRGIHIDNISHVFNYDLPYDPETYVHRIGRTGRAGNKGKAISFACEKNAFEIPAIEKYIAKSFIYKKPTEEQIVYIKD